jgi:hypothetical protein
MSYIISDIPQFSESIIYLDKWQAQQLNLMPEKAKKKKKRIYKKAK